MKKTKFVFDPICLIVWGWLFFTLGIGAAISYVFAIIIHEFGHFFVAKLLGYRLNRYAISIYGVSLSYFDQNVDSKDEIKIALAGPAINLLTALFVVAFWWLTPSTYFFTQSFVQISVVLALFNLLPCYPMDGGRVFVNLTSCFLNAKISRKITMAFNIVLSLLFLSLFVCFCFFNFNPSYLVFAFFLIAGLLDLKMVSKYEKINIFDKKPKNFVHPNFVCVNLDTTLRQLLDKISTTKTRVFLLTLKNGKMIILSEKMILKLASNFDLNTKIEEIIKK